MKKLKTSAAQMVEAARARIEEVETADLIAIVDDPNVVIVDIRDIRERQRGFIPGSEHAPRGMVEFWVDPDSPYFKEVFGQDKKYVFHCASGWRSALTVARRGKSPVGLSRVPNPKSDPGLKRDPTLGRLFAGMNHTAVRAGALIF